MLLCGPLLPSWIHLTTTGLQLFCWILSQMARLIGPTWGPPGSCRPRKPCYQGCNQYLVMLHKPGKHNVMTTAYNCYMCICTYMYIRDIHYIRVGFVCAILSIHMVQKWIKIFHFSINLDTLKEITFDISKVMSQSLQVAFVQIVIRGPFHHQGLPLIPTWICNYIRYNVWDAITYFFPNFNAAAFDYLSILGS